MDKVFKKLYVFLTYILVLSTSLMVFAIPPYVKSERKLDFFSSSSIVDSIKNLELNMTSIVYVKNSKGEWEEYQRLHGTENRIWVGIDKVPENLKNSFIAIEDETFYKHSGINWKRTLGAIGNYALHFDDSDFGGSTITQQLIKNITMDNGHNALRKAREIVRAFLVEKGLSKTEILEAYLNTIALGNGICGVQVAANYYFNKDVSELTLAECATIAAITQNPSKYNPISNEENNILRRNTVLKKMYELGMISEEDFLSASASELLLDTSRENNLEAEINDYFVDALIEQIIADLSVKYNCTEDIASSMLYNGGYRIYSTMDMSIQNTMEAVYKNVSKFFSLKGKDISGNTVNVQSAMTVMDYSGHIVGLVGGVGEKSVNRGLNRATQSPRQPGSTMKPIGVYALAVEKNIINYSSKVLDQPIEKYYPDGKKGPKEWYGYYKGNITVDYAIRKSANTIPVRLLQDIGIDASYDFLVNKLHCNHLNEGDKNLASLALGGCTYGLTTTESAAAYAIFGNLGVYHKPSTYYTVERVDGEVVLDYDETGEQVISPETATIMNHLLQGVVYGSEGTGSGIRSFSSMKAYAKTGTSSESNDLWMVAGSPYYVGSVWYGFDKMQEVKSTSGAATVWKEVMTKVHKGLKTIEFTDSEGVYKKGAGYYKNGTIVNNTLSETVSSEVSSTQETVSSNTSQTSSQDTTSQDSSKTESTASGEKPDDDTSSKDDEKKESSEEGTSSDSSGTQSESTESKEPPSSKENNTHGN